MFIPLEARQNVNPKRLQGNSPMHLLYTIDTNKNTPKCCHFVSARGRGRPYAQQKHSGSAYSTSCRFLTATTLPFPQPGPAGAWVGGANNNNIVVRGRSSAKQVARQQSRPASTTASPGEWPKVARRGVNGGPKVPRGGTVRGTVRRIASRVALTQFIVRASEMHRLAALGVWRGVRRGVWRGGAR